MTTKVEKTTTNDGNIITTTTTATTEEVIDDEPEKLDFDFDPSKQLNEALEKQRQEERDAFQNLIQENVRLDKEALRAREDASIYQAKFEALKIELDDLKKGKSHQEEKPKEEKQQHVGYEQTSEEVENCRVKIRELEVRLQQLAEDDRIKDKIIENCNNKESELEKYIDELEKELGEERVKNLKETIEARKEVGKEAKIVDRSQIVRQGKAQSAICSIM